jgi:hypothetical protein
LLHVGQTGGVIGGIVVAICGHAGQTKGRQGS